MDKKYNKEKAIKDLLGSVEFLKDSVIQYEAGKHFYHKLMAIQLYALLCGDNSLVNRMFPEARLNKIVESKNLSDSKKTGKIPTLQMIGSLNFDGKGQVEYELFTEEFIPAKEWLNQTVIVIDKKEISIDTLIKGVRDKSAAHFDPNYHEDLEKLNELYYVSINSYEGLIYTISKYLTGFLQEVIRHNNFT